MALKPALRLWSTAKTLVLDIKTHFAGSHHVDQLPPPLPGQRKPIRSWSRLFGLAPPSPDPSSPGPLFSLLKHHAPKSYRSRLQSERDHPRFCIHHRSLTARYLRHPPHSNGRDTSINTSRMPRSQQLPPSKSVFFTTSSSWCGGSFLPFKQSPARDAVTPATRLRLFAAVVNNPAASSGVDWAAKATHPAAVTVNPRAHALLYHPNG